MTALDQLGSNAEEKLPEERDVSLEYLQCLHDKHERWLAGKDKFIMPDGQTEVPVLVLNCDHEFETDTQQAQLHLRTVADFIATLS